MIAQIFISTGELVIPTGTQTSKVNAEIEIQSVTAEARISKFSTKFKHSHVFLNFSPIKSLCVISSKRKFLA